MKKIALACTGGGVKACVNIGVLRALDELNVKIEAISGASLGALVSLLYLCNYSPKEILEVFQSQILKIQNFSALDTISAIPRLLINGGMKNPKFLVEFMQKIEKEKNINTLKDIDTPLIIPALDISSREVIYYSSKPLDKNLTYYCNRPISEAIRSSCAIPLFFTPNKVCMDNKNHFMLDGGILTNTLISPLTQFSNYIIGITNKFYPKERNRVNLGTGFTQTFQSMRKSYLFKEKQNCDLWIEIETKTNKFVGSHEEVIHFEKLRL